MVATQSQINILDAASTTIAMATVLDGGEHRPQNVVVRLGKIGRFFRRYLDTVGDGTGTKNAIGDYSAAQTIFKLTPAAGTVYHIDKLKIVVSDTPAADLDVDKYGVIAALTNGIGIDKWDGSSVDDFSDNLRIKTFADWALLCGNDLNLTYGSSITNGFGIWTWTPSSPIRLVGDSSEDFRLTLDDSFAALLTHYFVVEGIIETTTV